MIQIPPPTHSARTGNSLDLAGMPRGPEFIADGLCAQTDPAVFFVERGGCTKAAKRICALCPAQVDCLAWAIDTDQAWGVWGGKSEHERRKIKRQGRAS